MLDLPFDRLTAAWTPIAPEYGDDVWLRELTARYLGLELSEATGRVGSPRRCPPAITSSLSSLSWHCWPSSS
jgi:hypothetical protein